jgi:hypothetical protein
MRPVTHSTDMTAWAPCDLCCTVPHGVTPISISYTRQFSSQDIPPLQAP